MFNSLYFTNENIPGVSSGNMNSTQVVAAKRISYLWRVSIVMPVECTKKDHPREFLYNVYLIILIFLLLYLFFLLLYQMVILR